jgi:hypothetical protein
MRCDIDESLQLSGVAGGTGLKYPHILESHHRRNPGYGNRGKSAYGCGVAGDGRDKHTAAVQ